ncbi:serine protease [Pilimelia terevasa]|uniref:Serine protease n=1 Tax=Pilimelia terevasa TaxID=53372 RepID=A0A8J3BN33_9ACTN|nr:trypsin-like serine protease [Pilimelia terevasa]GGK26404.1 serine protease [Pilimelia terevasa]
MIRRMTHLCGALAAGLLAIPALAHAAPAAEPAPANRIIDGEEVADAPWAAALFKNGSFSCSGSVIGAEWVLTAQHCVGNTGASSGLTVKVGKVRHAEGEVIEVAQQTVRHDLAVLKLKKPVSNPVLVRLASADPATNSENSLYGWGRTCRDCPASPVLKTARVKVTSTSAKDGKGGPGIRTGRVNGLAWKGDSGGPQMYNGEQVGVCSVGDGSSYQIYGSVAASREWIRSVAGV